MSDLNFPVNRPLCVCVCVCVCVCACVRAHVHDVQRTHTHYAVHNTLLCVHRSHNISKSLGCIMTSDINTVCSCALTHYHKVR